MNASLRQRVLVGVAVSLAAWSAWSVFKSAEAPAADSTKRARHAVSLGAPAAPNTATAPRSVAPTPAAAQAMTVRNAVNVAASRNPFDANPWVVKREPQKVAAPVLAPPSAIEVKAPAPPPPPLQLPYRFLGTYAEQTDSPSVFLALGERLIVAKAGDALDGGFRLEAVSPRELTFVHVQQNVTLRLSVTGGPI